MKKIFGKIDWVDLTVADAGDLSDFYSQVIGWEKESVPVDDYEDFTMNSSGGEAAVGICHKKGMNKNIPSQWLVYVEVEDLQSSLVTCEKLGGKIIQPIGPMGKDNFAIIQDPAGAVMALYQKGS